MKKWRVVATDDNGRGVGEEFTLRWQAEEAYEAHRGPGKLVTLAEFQDNKMVEIVRDSRWEKVK